MTDRLTDIEQNFQSLHTLENNQKKDREIYNEYKSNQYI